MRGRSEVKMFVGVTDHQWFQRLRALRPDDVNFWRPSGRGFAALEPGDPFLFKLHAPWNAIVLSPMAGSISKGAIRLST